MRNYHNYLFILLFIFSIEANAIQCPIEPSEQSLKESLSTETWWTQSQYQKYKQTLADAIRTKDNQILLAINLRDYTASPFELRSMLLLFDENHTLLKPLPLSDNHQITHLVEGEKEFLVIGYQQQLPLPPQIFAATLPKPFLSTKLSELKPYKQTAQNWFWPNTATYVNHVRTNNGFFFLCGWQSEKFGGEQKPWFVKFQNQRFEEQWQKFLSDGLVAYYPFNGNAKDASGNGNDGTVHGATLTEDRLRNKDSAYSFDGKEDYIEIHDNNTLDVSNELTVSLWANNLTALGSSDNVIIDKMVSDPKGPFELLLCYSEGYKLEGRFTISKAGVVDLKTGKVPPTNIWQHYVLTFKSGAQKLYINSSIAATQTVIGSLKTNDLPIQIGKGVERKYHFHGLIDDIRIYNRALSNSEVQLLYQIEKTGLINQLSQTPRSCNHALALGINHRNGIYTIDPDGEGGIQAFEVYCDMESSEVGLTFYLIEGGITTSKVSDNDSCKKRGLKIFAPRTKQDYEAARKYLISINKPTAFGPLGVYHPNPAQKKRPWTSSIPMNSANAGAQFGWKSAAGNIWWISNRTDITEPNGDYTEDCWLKIDYDDSGNVSWYNDALCDYSYNSYLCMGM